MESEDESDEEDESCVNTDCFEHLHARKCTKSVTNCNGTEERDFCTRNVTYVYRGSGDLTAWVRG